MKIDDALREIKLKSYIPFEKLFSEQQLINIIKAKGKTGQILELSLGLNLTNAGLDFEDGELKTNKTDLNGKPLETMFICQIASMIDDLLNHKKFEETYLFRKIENILYVPVCKMGVPKQWFFHEPLIIRRSDPSYKKVYEQIEEDYYTICFELNNHINETGKIHTSNGELIQIRSKDSKPYHSIYSNKYNKSISNKNHAFYFKKKFINSIISIDKQNND